MKVFILKLAKNDLNEIHEYLFQLGENPSKKFRESFENFCVQVTNMPYIFAQYEYNPNYRKTVIAFGYLIFYQVDKKSGQVKVYRVLHGKRNIEPLLEP